MIPAYPLQRRTASPTLASYIPSSRQESYIRFDHHADTYGVIEIPERCNLSADA